MVITTIPGFVQPGWNNYTVSLDGEDLSLGCRYADDERGVVVILGTKGQEWCSKHRAYRVWAVFPLDGLCCVEVYGDVVLYDKGVRVTPEKTSGPAA